MRFIEYLVKHGGVHTFLRESLTGCRDLALDRKACLCRAAHGFAPDEPFDHQLCNTRLLLLRSYGIDPMQLVIERAIAADRAKHVVLGPEFVQQIIDGHEAVDDDEPTIP